MTHRFALPAAAIVAAALAACQDQAATASPGQARLAAQTGAATSILFDAGRPALARLMIEDPHQRGRATSFQLASVSYGRIVELWGKNRQGRHVRVASEFVIGDTYTGDGQHVTLVSQPVLGTDRLMIDGVVDGSNAERQRFLDLAEAAAVTATPLSDAGVDGSGRLTPVPRNAALVLQFNDLVDPESVLGLSAKLATGWPSITPLGARLVAHDLLGGVDAATGEFRSTRVIVDTTVSVMDARKSTDGLAVNPLGFPAPVQGGVPHAELRLPTVAISGVSSSIRSSGGTPLGVSPGSVDYSSASVDLVRPFSVLSSGGPYLGFMMDTTAPRLVAEAEIQITMAPVQDPTMADVFTLPRLQFASEGCAGPAQVGDIVTQPGVVAEVIADGGPATGAGLDGTQVRLLEFPAGWTGPEQWTTDGVGVAFYQAPYDLTMDARRIACLVDVAPAPLGGAAAPTRGIDPAASFQLRFNETIADSGSAEIESVLISTTPIPDLGPFNPRSVALAEGRSFGMSTLSGGYLVQPEVPLAHAAGVAEVYYITPRTDLNGVRDLAGNRLLESPGPIAMSIDPSAAPVASGSVMLGFENPSELGNAGSDLSGQLSYDALEKRVRSRPVVRSLSVLDNNESALLAQMTPFPSGVQTPFNHRGAKMQTLWRYSDMGFGIADPSTANIDVEGLYWNPAGGSVVFDSFPGFEIKLSHSRFAPDELIDPNSLFPRFPNSGLTSTYADNVLEDEAQEVVHPRQLGYSINPQDVVTTANGTKLMPFPVNRVAGEPKRTFTWRDTTKRQRTGEENGGLESEAYLAALGLPAPPEPYYPTGEIQTLGLPLLMDFSVFLDGVATSSNRWALNLAVNSSSRPYFRAFSAGGTRQNGTITIVDPDAETTANGGFNPASNPPGAETFGLDNSFMLGAADLVARKSVVHTVWVEAGASSAARQFTQPIVSSPLGQSLATSVSIDVRGATEIVYDNSGDPATDNDGDENGVVDYLEEALALDLYGDFYNEADQVGLSHRVAYENPGLAFTGSGSVANGSDWRADASTIEGSRYVQLRLTFESDLETGDVAIATALGIAWTE